MIAWKPPQRLTVSQWADERRVLGSESSAEPGRWDTNRAPYQRAIMDAVNDPEVETVVVMASAQVGKTEILLNILGWAVDVEPCPVLFVQPTVEMAEDFSKRRIAPMIRLCESLRERVADVKSRDSGNTILIKSFPGGSLALTGANSPTGLASRPCRIVLCDEVDRFPPSAGTEGDPVKLASKRAATFWNRKKVYTSTPGRKGTSRIESEYALGTQEEWCFECPSCGEYHAVRLPDLRYEDVSSLTVKRIRGLRWVCPACGLAMTEKEVKRAPATWVARNPEARGTRSFWLNAFASPWSGWEALVLEFLECKGDPLKMQTYVNTILGESYEEVFGELQPEALLKRREDYGAEVPDGAVALTCGLDTQDDRLEYEVVGWGEGDESWGIERGMILGEPDDSRVWRQVDDLLERTFRRADGRGLKIACAFMDSGGHYTRTVYRECRIREARRLYAIKGFGGESIPYVTPPKREAEYGAKLLKLGVDSGKQLISTALQLETRGPRYCHFPIRPEARYDLNAFEGLLSERLVLKRAKGMDRYVWEKIRSGVRNEALDCRNYAQAAVHALRPNYEALRKRLEKGDPKPGKPAPRKRPGVVSEGVTV